MKVISLKDYATEKGISYEAVRQQVVRYKEELEPHIIRDGRQQFLDEEAVAFLDAKRQKNPVAIIQQDKNEQIEALEDQVKQLLVKTASQADRISELAQWKADNAVAIAEARQTQILLGNVQQEVKQLQGDLTDAKSEISVLAAERDKEKEKADTAIQDAQDAAERARRAEERNRILEDYAAACEEYRKLPRWRRAFKDPPIPPNLQEDE